MISKGSERVLVGSEDFKSFCRALITSGVGSIPTRSRQRLRGGPGWVRVCSGVVMHLPAALILLSSVMMLLPAVAMSAPADPTTDLLQGTVRVLASNVTLGEASSLAPTLGDSSGMTPIVGDPSGVTPMAGDSSGTQPMAADSSGMIPTMGDTLPPAVPASSRGTDSVGSGPVGARRNEEPPSEAWTTIKSGVVPGWGQLVNKEPLKAGLFFGAWAFFAGQAIVAEQDRKDAQEAFDASGDVSDMEAVNAAVDRRNSRLWWMGGVALFSMLDAYVDVHFWKFEEQWSARLGPTPEGGAALALRLTLE